VKNRTLFRQFFGLQIVILLGAISFVAGYTWFSSKETFYTQWFNELENQSRLIGTLLIDEQGTIQADETERLFKRIADAGGHRFTLILPDGHVVADTEADTRQLDVHSNRPEIREALEKGQGMSRRYSTSLDRQMIYLAHRIPKSGPAKGVIRVAVPERKLLRELSAETRMIIVLSIIVFSAALSISYWTSLRIIGPVSDIQKGVQSLGNGDFSFRLAIPPVPHLAMLAHSINQMAEQVEKLSTIRQDFVANVSHELRTPVTSIKGFAETLLDGAKDDPSACERFLGIILHQANQLEAIIHDLLELSQMEAHSGQHLERCAVDLAPLLQHAVDLCSARAEEKQIQLHLSCEQGLTANIHAGLIEQALINLIDNAVAYGATPERPYVDIAASRCTTCTYSEHTSYTTGNPVSENAIVITVRDYGHGIAPEHLDRLFERFYRVDKGRSRDTGGTGLGLSIVKHIAIIHGGSVAVESEPGKGSTFMLTLPAAECS
jgi:signal transduction histidine kinase